MQTQLKRPHAWAGRLHGRAGCTHIGQVFLQHCTTPFGFRLPLFKRGNQRPLIRQLLLQPSNHIRLLFAFAADTFATQEGSRTIPESERYARAQRIMDRVKR
jgi:hypothetical protein